MASQLAQRELTAEDVEEVCSTAQIMSMCAAPSGWLNLGEALTAWLEPARSAAEARRVAKEEEQPPEGSESAAEEAARASVVLEEAEAWEEELTVTAKGELLCMASDVECVGGKALAAAYGAKLGGGGKGRRRAAEGRRRGQGKGR